MSLFRLPKGVKARLEKIKRDFLWEGGTLERKFHLVNWNTVCSSKEKGGLGVRDLSLVNKALLGKWVWRFTEEDNSIWKDVINIKYLVEEGGWFPKTTRGNSGLSPWKDISKEIGLMKLNRVFAIGDESKVRLWEDTWCGESPLCDIFPNLYMLAGTKGVKVADVWDNSRGHGAWSPSFSRLFNDWEIDETQSFLSLISNRKFNQMEQDKLLWKGDLNGRYTIRANVTLLEGFSDRTTPWKMLWNNLVPLKVSFFAWEVWWEKILTTEHLKKRGFQLASRCPLCGKAEENLNQLLIHCPSVWSLWEGLIYVLDLC